MIDITIMAEQTVTATEMDGVYLLGFTEVPTLIEGETYRVSFDGTDYTCIAKAATLGTSDGIGIGNFAIYGLGDDTGEPFLIGMTVDGASVMALTTLEGESHTVAIYQVVEETAPAASYDIVLKDRNGNGITYPGVNYINVATADGGTKGFASYDPDTLIPENLVDGVVVGDVTGSQTVWVPEETTVDLDFSAGDMEVVPDGDTALFSKVTISQPETLIPENIAADVVIAGITGTFGADSGESKFVYKTGSFTGSYSSTKTISHNLGVVPDIIIMYTSSSATSTSYYRIMQSCSFSSAMASKINNSFSHMMVALKPQTASSSLKMELKASGYRADRCIDYTSTSTYSLIYNATETDFTVAGNNGSIALCDSTYYWIAIGGLT